MPMLRGPSGIPWSSARRVPAAGSGSDRSDQAGHRRQSMPARRIARTSAITLICAVQAFGGSSAPAQPLSNRPMTLVSPFAAGASTDFALRVIAQKISDAGGTKVVIDNRPGGAGVIAANAVKTALPDGSSLLFANVGLFASNVSRVANRSYDPLEVL